MRRIAEASKLTKPKPETPGNVLNISCACFRKQKMGCVYGQFPRLALMICQFHYGDAIVSFAIITEAIGFNQRMLG